MVSKSSLLALLMIGVLAAGCASEPAAPTTTPTPSPTATATPTASPTPTATPTVPVTTGSITVGTEAAYPPFEDTLASGEIVGFDIDVMKEVAKRAGLTVTFQNAAFQAIIPSVQSGQFQAGISAFTITEERREQVAFSVSYYDNELMVAVLSTNEDITKESDLAGKKVCTQTGTTSEAWLRAEAGATNESLVLLDAFPPCVDALKRGDVDAIMIDRAAVRDLIAKSEGSLKEAFVVPTDEKFGIVVSKDNVALLTQINTALVSMKQDGSLDAMKDKWSV